MAKGVDPKVRAKVIERAESRCERCGRWCDTSQGFYSLQHRRARGMGGSRDPITNSAVNLTLLCGHATQPDHCHSYIEAHAYHAAEHGWRVAQHRSPAATPIRHWEHGLVYLTEAFGYADEAAVA
jgi:hypothetical protein